MPPSSSTVLALSGGCALGGLLLCLQARRPRSIEAVPTKMKQAFLLKGDADISQAKIEVREVEVPQPRGNQILVKVAAAPVNPSDDGQWKDPRVQTPTPIGIECSGVVVASGGGLFASWLLGKKVSATPGSGTYAEYVVCDAVKSAYSLPQQLPVELGCSFFVNPFTAVGIMESVREAGGKALIHTAGASQLGQMLVKLCQREGMTVVSVVRRVEQKDILTKLGCDPKHIVVTGSDDAWKKSMKVLIRELRIKHAFDAIAGETSGELLSLLPPGGCVWVYGRLSDKPVSAVDPLDLIYRGKELRGFMIGTWMMQDGVLRGLRRSMRVAGIVRKYLTSVFASDFVDTSLEDLQRSYSQLKENGVSGAKLRIRFL